MSETNTVEPKTLKPNPLKCADIKKRLPYRAICCHTCHIEADDNESAHTSMMVPEGWAHVCCAMGEMLKHVRPEALNPSPNTPPKKEGE